MFVSVAVDAAGNVYAAGYQDGTYIYTYGDGVTAWGSSSNGNVVLVKYDSNGTALWARTVSTGTNSSFNAVALDASGNVYSAGSQRGDGIYTYGDGVSVHGTASGIGNNVVLVKYGSNGTALWARTVSTGTLDSQFHAVAADVTGNVYAAGFQSGTGTYTYGDGITAQGTASGQNVVLVKYREE